MNRSQRRANKKPRTSRPATLRDVNRAKRQAQDEAINLAWAIFFSVMRDKEGYGPKRLRRLWDEVNYLSDSIVQGYVSVNDLFRALEEEAGITFGKAAD